MKNFTPTLFSAIALFVLISCSENAIEEPATLQFTKAPKLLSEQRIGNKVIHYHYDDQNSLKSINVNDESFIEPIYNKEKIVAMHYLERGALTNIDEYEYSGKNVATFTKRNKQNKLKLHHENTYNDDGVLFHQKEFVFYSDINFRVKEYYYIYDVIQNTVRKIDKKSPDNYTFTRYDENKFPWFDIPYMQPIFGVLGSPKNNNPILEQEFIDGKLHSTTTFSNEYDSEKFITKCTKITKYEDGTPQKSETITYRYIKK